MVSLSCAEARSYTATGYRLSRPYEIRSGSWTPVECAADLEYLLNHRGVAFREQPELGLRYYRCLAASAVHLPGVHKPQKFTPGEIIPVNGVYGRTLAQHNAFERVPVTEVLASAPSLRLLITRNGGLGDLFLTLPAVRRLHAEWPEATICYSTAPELRRLLETEGAVNTVYGPMEAYEDAPFGYVLDLGYWAETAPGIDTVHRADVFGHAFGFEQVADYWFDYRVLPDERQWAVGRLGGKPTIALQVSGSIDRRCPPPTWWQEFSSRLRARGYMVLAFGEREEPWDVDFNLTGKPPVWQVMALLEQCQGVVAGDSGILHAANALNRPTVGLFGAVDPRLRVRNHPLCRVVTGNEAAGCLPCNDHQLHQCEGYPPCMKLIDQDEVFNSLQEVMALGCVPR